MPELVHATPWPWHILGTDVRAIHTVSLPSAPTPHHKSIITKEMKYKNGDGNEIKQKFCLVFMFGYLFLIFDHKLLTS